MVELSGDDDAERRTPWTRRVRSAHALAIGSCWILGVLAFWIVDRWHAHRERDELRERAELAAAHLESTFAAPLEVLDAVRALLESDGQGVSPITFLHFCGPLLTRNPALSAIGWMPLVPDFDRAAFEEAMSTVRPTYRVHEPQGRVEAGDLMAPPLHLPIAFSCPPNEALLGLDFGRFLDAGLRSAFDANGQADLVWATPQNLVETSGERSLAVFIATREARFAPTRVDDENVDGRPRLADRFAQGFVVGIFRLKVLFAVATAAAKLESFEAAVLDPTAAKESSLLFGDAPPTTPVARHDLHFANQVYQLVIWKRHPEAHGLPWLWLAFVGTLGSALVFLIQSGRRRRNLENQLRHFGQYQLERKIAEGGMASVYKAKHALLKRPTAIKIARPELPAQHFEREVKLQSSLTHPNTTTVYDFGRGDKGQFYCAMEYIDGYDLETLVTRFGPLPPARALRILHQAAASLAEAHDKSFIHQDIKPSNIMITERGGMLDFVKVLDFGLARVRNISVSMNASHSLDGAMLFAGTPGFAAPEVAAGAQGSPAADIFSLGAVGYFLLTGRGPLQDGQARVFLALSPAERATLLCTVVPRELAELLGSCLSPKLGERPLSMRGLSDQLKRAIAILPAWTAEDAEKWWAEHPAHPVTGDAVSSFPL